MGGDDQLPDRACSYAARRAVGVELMTAGDAQPRLERAFRVVDAGVDDFGIARAGAGADRVLRFQHEDLAPSHRKPPRNAKADDPGPGDDALDMIGHCRRITRCTAATIIADTRRLASS